MEYEAQDLLQALLIVWNELPELLGPSWAKVRARLDWIVALLLEGGTPNPETWLGEELNRVLQEHPRARKRLERAVRTAAQARAPITTEATNLRAGSHPPVSAPSFADLHLIRLAAQLQKWIHPPPVIRHTDISCPDRVSLQSRRVSAVVRLTTRAPGDSAGKAELAMQEAQPVQVRLEAPAFEMLNEPLQQTVVRPGADSPPLVFDLRPGKAGHSLLTFDFLQQGNPVGTISVPIECVAGEVAAGTAPAAAAAVRLGTSAAPPDRVLLITQHVSPPALQMTLTRDGGAWWRSFAPVPLQRDPAAFATQLYRHLTDLTHRLDPVTSGHTGQATRPPTGPEIDQRVRVLGRNLWRDLIPQELKDLYAQERSAWRDSSLLILSDEPHLPWELVWPYGVGWQDELPWCCTQRLTRWLRRDDRGNGNESPPAWIALRSLAVLAPFDAGLPGACAEGKWLRALAAGHQVKDVSPTATWEAVVRLLEGGDYDWLHVAAHGKFHVASPDSDTMLWLEDRASLTPAMIVGPEIEGHLQGRRPAFVFNACEVGQQGWGLTRMAGWATRLVSAGAGLFAGPLWEITDDGAQAFVESFYESLLAGDTVAEAVQNARLKARKEGDPTWLAYSFYAHPNARVSRAPNLP